jgi:polyhydroxybutyrate depolymerase
VTARWLVAAALATSLVAIAAALAAGGPAPACTAPTAGDHRIVVDSAHPAVLVHVPPGAAAERRTLVMALPGAGMTGRAMADYTGYSRLADQKGFLVAYPTASGARPFWNVSGKMAGKPDDVGYLRRVIATLTGPAACGDAKHVGVTGLSNGGGMSALMACEAADLLAAAAPVAGGYSALPDCHPERALPILEIHGLRDEVVPYGGKGPRGAGAVGPFVDAWRERDRCAGAARRSAPAHNVQELRWTCAKGRVIVHDRVVDAEHGWPGEDSLRPFSSTVRTWRFLSAFTDEDKA